LSTCGDYLLPSTEGVLLSYTWTHSSKRVHMWMSSYITISRMSHGQTIKQRRHPAARDLNKLLSIFSKKFVEEVRDDYSTIIPWRTNGSSKTNNILLYEELELKPI
jgi:hypothetical protein